MRFSICFFLLLVSCDIGFVNKKTSEIGHLWHVCTYNQWDTIFKKYSTDNISDSIFVNGLKLVKGHFLPVERIIYFEDYPKEIVGFDYDVIRVAFNPEISEDAFNGLSEVSDEEQVRIRNRVLSVLYPYECPEGKQKILEGMSHPAPFSEDKKED